VAIVSQFMVLSRYLTAYTKESHKRPQSGQQPQGRDLNTSHPRYEAAVLIYRYVKYEIKCVCWSVHRIQWMSLWKR